VPPKASGQKHPVSKPRAAQTSIFCFISQGAILRALAEKQALLQPDKHSNLAGKPRLETGNISTYFHADARNSLRKRWQLESRRDMVENWKTLEVCQTWEEQSVTRLMHKAY
jgi:hypothetical protein